MASSSPKPSSSSAPSKKPSSPKANNATHSDQQQQQQPTANFAKSSISYDHESYLQLIAGSSRAGDASAKTANQVYREERARRLTTRALDPAILVEPRGDPSPVDFECAEIQRKRDRLQ